MSFSTPNVFTATNYQQGHNESQRIVDYFCVVGLPKQLTSEVPPTSEPDVDSNRKLFYPDQEPGRHITSSQEPIVELVVLNKTLNEFVPPGFECLWLTKAGHSANLNHSDAMFKTNHEMFICFRRGRDKPPITDIGIYYEGVERVMNGCQVILKTVGGSSANVNNSSFSGDRIFVTYRRSNELACNSLAVVEVCVIIKSKGEYAPHTFNEIPKNLNRGLFGASVFLCYKKAWIPAPQIKYLPTIQYRYPPTDHTDLHFPTEVAMFGLPMGAVIESCLIPDAPTPTSTPLTRPTFSTFVLNVTTEDGAIAEKVYGASIMFYEPFNHVKLNKEQTELLNYDSSQRKLQSNKCLLLLSRHALFEAFKEFLFFLYRKFTRSFTVQEIIPLEKYLIHLIYDVPFPTHQKPRVLVNLTEHEEDCLTVNLPDECILPQSGASFIDLLKNFGIDNSINVFLFVLLQRNVMVHSLRRVVLTGVVEALSCIIFPFLWRYNYLPMCPLNLCQLIEAPGSFILGMDSRFFDLFDAPDNVICVDLDTNTISWTPDRNTINQKILPKRPLNILRNRLTQLYKEIDELTSSYVEVNKWDDQDPRYRRRKRELELSIREAFLRFMTSIMQNYKQFMRAVTRRPNQTALDRNLATFFDCEGFVQSKESNSRLFFHELTKTQLFYDCIMNLSFATELDQSLIDSFAYFAECCSKQLRDDERFLDLHDSASSTVVILPPTPYPSNQLDDTTDLTILQSSFNTKDYLFLANSDFVYNNLVASDIFRTFPKLKQELGLKTVNPVFCSVDSLHISVAQSDSLLSGQGRKESFNSTGMDTQSISSSSNQQQAIRKLKVPNTPVGVRTNAEKMQSQRKVELILSAKQFPVASSVKQSEKSRFSAAKCRVLCLLSNSYALWFIYLAEHLRVCMENRKLGLNYAYQVLIQMQNHGLAQPDEICFRTMMQLALFYKQPTLAVKTFLHMKLHKIELTPITYSYYNMALIDPSNWPSFEQDRWAKVRLTWNVICRFKNCLRLKREREEHEECMRRANMKKKQKRRKSNHEKSGGHRKSSTNKNKSLIKKPDNDSTDISGHFKLLDSPLANPTQTKAETAKQQATIERVPRVRKNSGNIYNLEEGDKFNAKRQFFENKTIKEIDAWKKEVQAKLNEDFGLTWMDCCQDYLIFSSGIIFISAQKLAKLAHQSLTQQKLNQFVSDTNILEKLNIDSTSNEDFRKVIASLKIKPASEDPLNAMAKAAEENETTVEDDVQKRLFDYKPFEKEIETPPSDFVFDPVSEIPVEREQLQRMPEVVSVIEEGSELGQEADDLEDQMNVSYYDSDEEIEESDNEETDSDLDSYMDDDDDDSYQRKASSQDIRSNESVRSINGSIESGACPDTASQSSAKFSSTISDLHDSQSFSSPPNNRATAPKNSSFETPNTVTNKFSMFMKRMETSIEMSGKFKGQVTKYLADKSGEIKDVIMTSAVSPEVTSKLKSISNYQLNAGQYLNGLVKSNSTYVASNNYGHSVARKGSQETPTGSYAFQKRLFEKQKSVIDPAENSKHDLEGFPDEETFKPISVKWWGLEKDGDAKKNPFNELDKDALVQSYLVDVQISSCNSCESCKSYLYDEEIMAGWSLNDSDLNVKCVHCSSLLVPKLYVNVRDQEPIQEYAQTNFLLDPDEGKDQLHPFNDIEPIELENSPTKPPTNKIFTDSNEFTVEYLSPLVVRKEIENIILNKLNDTDALIDSSFMAKHAVIFWNLIWYFKRIGVDGCYLLDNLLNSRLAFCRQSLADLGYKLNDNQPNFLSNFQTKCSQPFGQHSRVKLTCLWDNLKLKNTNQTFEIPLYLSWLNASTLKINTASITKQLEHRFITVLTQTELDSVFKPTANSRSLAKIFDLIVRNVKEGEVGVPIKNLLRERTLSRLNFSSIYRELLYLLLVGLERYLIDVDAFDTEYRKAYKRILHNPISQELVKQADMPPNNVAVWSRRLFSPLAL